MNTSLDSLTVYINHLKKKSFNNFCLREVHLVSILLLEICKNIKKTTMFVHLYFQLQQQIVETRIYIQKVIIIYIKYIFFEMYTTVITHSTHFPQGF